MLPSRMPAVRDASIVKIAVEALAAGFLPQLIEFDQRQPLTSIINDICNSWNIEDSHNYSLKFTEQSNKGYVTEKNRCGVKNGTVLKLNYSATKTVTDFLEIFRNGSVIEQAKCLQKLASLSSDITFAIEFINKSGLDLLIKMIEDEKCIGERLEYALRSFGELMDHGTVSWEILSDAFVNRNIAAISNSSNSPHPIPPHLIASSLSILENVVQNSSRYALVERSVTFDTLLKLLREQNPNIQQNTIALINALFMRADEAKRKIIASTFSTKQYRSTLLDSCVLNAQIGKEMTHQLSVLQSLTLGMLEPRMNDRNVDADAQEKIKELRRIAFENESVENDSATAQRNKGPQQQQHYKKLGFKYDVNPAQDFMESSLLALDCMIYFARNQTQMYTKVVHENSCRSDEYECPFGRTSIELVKLLCDILKIGDDSFSNRDQFHPMFFTHDHPFEEFFCVCCVALNRTWKDMQAKNEDFSKVIDVVREQIIKSLETRPRDFESFRQKMAEFSYAKITELRYQKWVDRKECESTASAIIALKEKLRPEIMSIIREQRLGFLVEGTKFSKFNRGVRAKDKFWYVRLSSNYKVLHYGDCDEKTVPLHEELKNELRVSDMRQLLKNKDCPHVKEIKKLTTLFSIVYEDNSESKTLDLVAPDEISFNYWVDGIACLLGLPMESKQMKEDFETLLSIEIKLRLLDTEGVDISKEAPEIPPEPEDYEFNFEG
ncbi:hypothetical protein PVAND_005387 [Polypedilum vanderplanki]|uniref:ELMO domain-containing protein n=1 Tax=Polypedilum vanderplanki TaxID=319348 RepID=A0A9J6C095_POLVA|nr:hypothetical protein PVAND_005387 [Polypedilum vanderplanki]